MSELFCGRCGSPVSPESIDRQRELATCSNCGNLIDLRRVETTPAAATPEPSAEPSPVALPKGLRVEQSPGRLVVERAWRRPKHAVFALVIGAAIVAVVMQWAEVLRGEDSLSGLLVVATLFVAWWDFMLMAALINKTRVVVAEGRIASTTGPLPMPLASSASVNVSEVAQLFAIRMGGGPSGGVYAVMMELRDGSVKPLVRPLPFAEQALFIERRIEHALGIADRAVEGELPRDGAGTEATYVSQAGSRPLTSAPTSKRTPTPAPSGASGGVAIFVVSVLGLSVGMMLFMFNSSVEGVLTATGQSGSWRFQPDDCASGQTLGFMGVELTSEKDRSRRVRLIQDELGQQKVAVLTEGAAPQVFEAGTCTTLALKVARTGDVTNDVYLMKGDLTLECPGLVGKVKYDRCGL